MKTSRMIGHFQEELGQKKRETKTIVTEVNKDLNDSLNEFMKAEYRMLEKELLSNGFELTEVADILEQIKLKAHAELIQQLNQKVKELKTARSPAISSSDKNKAALPAQKTILAKR